MARGKKTGGKNWQPGQSGNPKGYKGFPKDLKEARKLNQAELERLVNKYLYFSQEEMDAHVSQPDTPMIEHMVASIISLASTKGDQLRLDFILNRLIGKVKDQVELTLPKPFIVEKRDGTKLAMGIQEPDDREWVEDPMQR